MARTGKPAIRHVAAVERAVARARRARRGRPELGTNEIARRTGINASTVSRLLATLAAARARRARRARRAATGSGSGSCSSATSCSPALDLRAIARPHLEALVAARPARRPRSRAPASTDAMTVDFVQSPASVQSVARIGRPSVAHATATGKVFLAFGGAAAGRASRGVHAADDHRSGARSRPRSRRRARTRLGAGGRRAGGRAERDRGAGARPRGGARGHPRRPGTGSSLLPRANEECGRATARAGIRNLRRAGLPRRHAPGA